MNRSVDGLPGRATLAMCHCAGMMDIVALPVWVGIVLIGQYGLDPQRAGALATLFLGAVVASSLVFAPRVMRIRGTFAAPLGFALAAASFFALSTTREFATMAALHFFGGLGVGCGLSFTHSAVGGSVNPHRLIAIGFTLLSVVALAFLAIVPQLINVSGGGVLFMVLGVIMLVAAVSAALAFPTRQGSSSLGESATKNAPLSRSVWFAMVGVTLMTLNQAMMFSFIERIGTERGFSHQQVLSVLIAVGVLNLFPALFAAVLERWLKARAVMVTGVAAQGMLALVITQSSLFGPYAVAASIYVSVLIFTHTFIFGFLARNDLSTRAVAATPVMSMVGSAVGPILGGVVAQHFGYASIGWAVACVSAVGVLCFWRAGWSANVALPTAEVTT